MFDQVQRGNDADCASDRAVSISRRYSHSIARCFFPVTGQEFPSDGTQGANDSRDGLSLVGRRPQWERRRGFNHSVHRQQRISPSGALDGLGNPPRAENRGLIEGAGLWNQFLRWRFGWRTIFVVDARRSEVGKRMEAVDQSKSNRPAPQRCIKPLRLTCGEAICDSHVRALLNRDQS